MKKEVILTGSREERLSKWRTASLPFVRGLEIRSSSGCRSRPESFEETLLFLSLS